VRSISEFAFEIGSKAGAVARGENLLSVGTNVGLALSFDFLRGDAEELLRQADTALYAAKGGSQLHLAYPESAGKKSGLPEGAADRESPVLTN
jgi:GGDEF domain-containing protein